MVRFAEQANLVNPQGSILAQPPEVGSPAPEGPTPGRLEPLIDPDHS